MLSLPCLPVELQDEIFSIAAQDLFEAYDYHSLLNLSVVDRRRHDRISPLVHSRHAAPCDGYFKSQGIPSPPDDVLTNNVGVVGKHVYNFLWHITGQQHVALLSELVFTMQMENVEVFTILITEYLPPLAWQNLVNSTRRWPVKRLELWLKMSLRQPHWNAYNYLFNGITEVSQEQYSFLPSLWSLTHLSVGVDDMPYFSTPFNTVLLNSTSSGLGSLTHLRVHFHPRVRELEEVDWEMLFTNHPSIQIVVLQFASGRVWQGSKGVVLLPEDEPRLVCALLGEDHPLGSTLWDARGSDLWFEAEKIRDQRLSYVEQLALIK